MFIVEDTRQQAGRHEAKHKAWAAHGDTITRCALPCGDYALFPRVSVDSKASMQEIAQNIGGTTKEHERFRRELERARQAGAKLYILVEQNHYSSNKERSKVEKPIDLIRWQSPYSVVRGEKIFRVLVGWMREFPLEVIFCDRRQTGRKIVQIIYGEDNE